jgi:hypothetical protein
VIGLIAAEVGQVVAAGQTVMRLARADTLEVAIAIPEGRMPEVRALGAAEVTLWADDKARYAGALREVSPVADPLTRTYAARVSIDQPDARVLLGMTAKLRFLRRDGSTRLTVPLTAIFQHDGKPALWIVGADGTVSLRPVAVASYREDTAVIESGARAGERIVVAGVHKLTAGERGAHHRASTRRAAVAAPGQAGTMTPPNLSEWALRHRSLTGYLIVVLMLAGVLAYFKLGRAEDPDYTFKAMVVRTLWPGATAPEVQLQVTERIERRLQEVPWVDVLRSQTRPGESLITVLLKDYTPKTVVPETLVPGAQEDRRHAPYAAAGRARAFHQRRIRRHLHHHLRADRRWLRPRRTAPRSRSHRPRAAPVAGRQEDRAVRRSGREGSISRCRTPNWRRWASTRWPSSTRCRSRMR